MFVIRHTRRVIRRGNDASRAVVLGIDVGSTNAKATVVDVAGDRVVELADASARLPQGSADAMVGSVRALMARVLDSAASHGLSPVEHIGITSMAESGALVGADGRPIGALVRWDARRDVSLPAGLDPMELHALTGVPATPKLPLGTWARLVRERDTSGLRWGFVSDLVAHSLTGRLATDHTLAGRSGAYALPAPAAALPPGWDPALLEAFGVPRSLPPEVLAPGEPVGTLAAPMRGAAAGATVWIAGHDHAVVAWLAGLRQPGAVVHSAGTTEAVLALAERDSPVDRRAAGMQGLSVVRSVTGEYEGVLAGSPAGGAMIARWRETHAHDHPDEVLARVDAIAGGHPDALMLPYPAGRRCPSPDPSATTLAVGTDGSAEGDLRAALRGMAAHGAWMRAASTAATGPANSIAAVGTPLRANRRLAGLLAALSQLPVDLVDLDTPAASAAAALAAQRAGAGSAPVAPTVRITPDDDGVPRLAERFHELVHSTTTTSRRTP